MVSREAAPLDLTPGGEYGHRSRYLSQDAEYVIIVLLLFILHARDTCTSTVLYFVYRFFFMPLLSLSPPNLVFHSLIAEVCSTDSES